MNIEFINNPNYEENDSLREANIFFDNRSVFDLNSNMEMNYYLYQSELNILSKEESLLSTSTIIKEEKSNIITTNNNYPNWLFYSLAISIFLLLFSNLIFYRKNNFNVKLLFNLKKFRTQLNESQIFSNWNTLILYLAYLSLISVIVFNFFKVFFDIDLFNNINNFFISCAFFFVLDLARYVINAYLGAIFNKKHTFFTLNSNLLYIRTILPVIIITPIIVSFFTYNYFLILTSIVIISLLETYRVLRQIILLISNKEFSILYNILYLCTLEIIPILVLCKLVLRYL